MTDECAAIRFQLRYSVTYASPPSFAPRFLHMRRERLDAALDGLEIKTQASVHRASSSSAGFRAGASREARSAPSIRHARAARSADIAGAARVAAPKK